MSKTAAVAEEPTEESSLPLLVEPREGVPAIIDSNEALDRASEQLSRSSAHVALDTERAQGRTYGSAAYLVQIRKSDVGTFLIDSNALTDLSTLSDALRGEWILHAADQDLACMADLGLRPGSLFDTEIAARLLGSERFGLGALTEEYLGIRLQKTHQNEDWSLRPLPQSWLAYAALDVELLPELRDLLWERLAASDRLEWANQEFLYELTSPNTPRPNNWRNLKGLGRVKRPEQLAIARELWKAREEIARESDTAPGRVLTGRAIIEAALSRPESREDLLRIGDFKRPKARKSLDNWWDATNRALKLTPDQYPQKTESDKFAVPAASHWKRMDPAAFDRLTEVREMVSAIAEPLGISPDMILSAKIQRALAWWPINRTTPTPQNPTTKRVRVATKANFVDAVVDRLREAEARPWQIELVKEHLLQEGDPLPKVRESLPRTGHTTN